MKRDKVDEIFYKNKIPHKNDKLSILLSIFNRNDLGYFRSSSSIMGVFFDLDN